MIFFRWTLFLWLFSGFLFSTMAETGLVDKNKVDKNKPTTQTEDNSKKEEDNGDYYSQYDFEDLNEEELAILREIKKLRLEREKLESEIQLLQTKNERELTELKLERDRLLFQAELEDARYQQKVATITAKKEQAVLENVLAEEERTQQRAEIEAKKSLLEAENNLREEKNRQFDLDVAQENSKIALETARIGLRREQANLEVDTLDQKINKRLKLEEWNSQANNTPAHLAKPLTDDNILFISDRRIELPDVILPGTAAYVSNQMDFFNNKNNEQPIFLIIDNCAGGSIIEGSKIIQAIQSSSAPVHVLVKAYAASMAAVIVSLAKQSYAYENALILHHQIIGGFNGNITQQKEYLDFTEQWAQRLLKPIADKMNITLDAFYQKMYENNSAGNWMEFADKAKTLGWVDHVIGRVRETGIQYPTQPPEIDFMLPFALENKAKTPTALPKLNVGDFYYMTKPTQP
jgi:ATP-dependent Clp protease protease subunit